MTAANDFGAVIHDQIAADWEIEWETIHPHDDAPYTVCTIIASPTEVTDSALAALIAAMCPDSKGRGWFIDMDDMGCERTCQHPNAPTIGGALTKWADAHQRAATNGHTIEQAMKVYEAVMGWDEDDLDVTVAEQRLIDALRKVAR